MSATEVLSALDRIHGTVSVIGSMNADYTVTAQDVYKRQRLGTYKYYDLHQVIDTALTAYEEQVEPLLKK